MLSSSGRSRTAAIAGSDSDSVGLQRHMTEREQCFLGILLLLSVPKLCIDGGR